MFWRHLRSSLIAQATFVIGILFVIALVRVIFVSGLNWMERHDDQAILAASSLRSSFNQLALSMAIEPGAPEQRELATEVQRLLREEHLRGALWRPGREALRGKWLALRRQWKGELAPALEASDAPRFLGAARPFALALDDLADDLQQEHQRLKILDLNQVIVTMLLVISLQLLAIYTLRRKVAAPLQRLLGATEQLRGGTLDVRVTHEADDEIGRLALSFNAMADALQGSHRALEQQVEQKVRQLALANAALEQLSRSSHELALGPADACEFEALLRRFEQLLPGLRLDIDQQGDVPVMPACAGRPGAHAYAISSQGQRLGELCACFDDARNPEPWESDLVQALADIIGSAVMLNRQREHNNQSLLLNERNTIARELHDSLAQSLSFMKLQIARLQVLIHEEQDCEAVSAVAEELRTGINDAYGQLRQLLSTFRLEIGRGELGSVLQNAVQEFARRSNLDIALHADPPPAGLSPDEETHLVQIMREALTNCVRHAEAVHVDVRLRAVGDEVELVVEDDGRGFAPASSSQPHHGIAIMRERALGIGGTLAIESRSPRGTRLCLRFRPARGAPPTEDANP